MQLHEIAAHADLLVGEVEVVASGNWDGTGASDRVVATITAPGFFGEMALIGESKERSATIRTIADCELYEILAEDFDRTVGASDAALKSVQQIARDQRAELEKWKSKKVPASGTGSEDFVIQKRSFVLHGQCNYDVYLAEQ